MSDLIIAEPRVVLTLDAVTMTYGGRSMFSRKVSGTPAVREVSLQLREGETLALVGESGSGKSSTARIALGMALPDSGTVSLYDRSVADMSRREYRNEFRPRVQMVFQNPGGALNPRKTIFRSVADAMLRWGHTTRRMARTDAIELLEQVGLGPGSRFLERRPHELSGGQLQRVGIAIALAVRPSVIIADEPVSALDVSVRGQVLNLLDEIRSERGVSILLITHDLSIVSASAQRVAVMYRGEIVEQGPTTEVLMNSAHEYTRALLTSVPRVERRRRDIRQSKSGIPETSYTDPGPKKQSK